MKSKPFFSIFVPSYNNSQTITDTLNSIKNQTFTDFKIILRDDGSKDNTLKIVEKYQEPRLKIYKNPKNLGYSGNLNRGIKDCTGQYIFLMAGDDLLDKNTLKLYFEALKRNPQAGVITRPYYWFDYDYRKPVRLKQTIGSITEELISINDSKEKLFKLFSSLDQLSGLCLKRELIHIDFCKEPWISHAYPWLDIFKNHPAIFIKEYILAVRIGFSATRSNIYQKSPMVCWKEMLDTIFFEKRFQKIKNIIISDFVGINYIGLVQIRNYGSFSSYIKEVINLVKFRKANLINIKFYLMVLITLLTPPIILRKITDKFKTHLYSKVISSKIIIKLA